MSRNWLKHVFLFFLVLTPFLKNNAQESPDSLLQLINSKSAEEVYSGYIGLAEFYQRKDTTTAADYLAKVDANIEELSDSTSHKLLVRKVAFYTQEYKNAEAVEFAKLTLKEATK